ncbi:hypothetical protein FHY64_09940 [Pelagovum pacificum]|uniref:Uncharacterized protein n=1 Tax=Pelagovum pacificum TaxID=2588711 RepID=A0A5C5GJL6_9RHOB|nr:hypothetical protein [Pelagovum pacificum]QQA44883.1 hypothetical protein I8N54_01585 [Pelagovum pacificum]TNY34364.1 hypothetical protein FHY64_09940 [Pelagovum pacificum]
MTGVQASYLKALRESAWE